MSSMEMDRSIPSLHICLKNVSFFAVITCSYLLQVLFDGLGKMSDLALEFFKKVIEQQYPLEITSKNAIDEDPIATGVLNIEIN